MLTDAGVSGQHVGVLHHGLVRGRVLRDFQHAAPLGKAASSLLVLSTPFRQTVETWGRDQQHNALVEGPSKGNNTFVHLDSWDDALIFSLISNLDKGDSSSCALPKGLVKKDHTTDVVGYDVVCCEQELSVLATILVSVGEVDVLQTDNTMMIYLTNRLVGGQDSFAWSHNGIGNFAKLILLSRGEVGCESRCRLCR
ncbi:hypothetical protein EGW08_022660, partial [Elysia chlorotica]